MLMCSAARRAREFAETFRLRTKSARGMPGAQCTRSLACAYCELSMHTSIHSGGTGKHPAFPTQWFYGFVRALLGDHRFVDPVIRATRWRPRELDACFGAPEPHGFTVREPQALVSRSARPPHPASRFVTIGRNAPCIEAGWRDENTHFRNTESKYLFARGQDRFFASRAPSGKSLRLQKAWSASWS